MSEDSDPSSDESPKSLDFTDDASTEINDFQLGDSYDPRPQEDSARRRIAYSLIGLLWVVVVAIFVLTACGSIKVSEIKEFAVILGPIVTLVSAATGFYYGTKSNGA